MKLSVSLPENVHAAVKKEAVDRGAKLITEVLAGIVATTTALVCFCRDPGSAARKTFPHDAHRSV